MDGFDVAAKKFDGDRKISVILDRTLAVSAVQNIRITGYFLIRSNGICRINGTFLIGSNVMLAPWDQVDLLKHWTIFKTLFHPARWNICWPHSLFYPHNLKPGSLHSQPRNVESVKEKSVLKLHPS